MHRPRSPLGVHDLTFRSFETFTQAGFVEWLKSVPADDLHHYELLDGHVVREPPAGWPHGQVEGEITWRLITHAKSRALGRAFGSSQGYALPSGDTVEPDVSFVAAERWIPQDTPGFIRVVPDLVFEILSPSTAMLDATQKKRIYARNGVREYVLVDCDRRELTVYRLGRRGYGAARVVPADQEFVSCSLPGFRFLVGELFTDL